MAGRNERLPGLAEELLRLNVEVIVAGNTPAAQVAKKAKNTIPVVMMRVADPVKSGLVASLARPGGNVTGLRAKAWLDKVSGISATSQVVKTHNGAATLRS